MARLVIVLILLSFGTASAEYWEYGAGGASESDATYIRDDTQTNHGAELNLWVRNATPKINTLFNPTVNVADSVLAVIDSAKVYMWNISACVDGTIEARMLTTAFVEMEATWDTASVTPLVLWTAPGGDYDDTKGGSMPYTCVAWTDSMEVDVTDIVQAWVDGTTQNGIHLRNDVSTGLRFGSDDRTTVSNRIKLKVWSSAAAGAAVHGVQSWGIRPATAKQQGADYTYGKGGIRP